MKQIAINPNNRKYYSDEFIRGFECGAERQFEADKTDADRPQEWIPCSERLPKKEEATYLICTEDGYMCSCRWTNNMYGLRSNEWSKWGWHVMDKPQYAKVAAWMPWEPWKGASNGENIQSADE